jgi:hypothetical protein
MKFRNNALSWPSEIIETTINQGDNSTFIWNWILYVSQGWIKQIYIRRVDQHHGFQFFLNQPTLTEALEMHQWIFSQTVLSSLQRKGEESNHQRILLDKIYKFSVFPDWKKENYVPFFIYFFLNSNKISWFLVLKLKMAEKCYNCPN